MVQQLLYLLHYFSYFAQLCKCVLKFQIPSHIVIVLFIKFLHLNPPDVKLQHFNFEVKCIKFNDEKKREKYVEAEGGYEKPKSFTYSLKGSTSS